MLNAAEYRKVGPLGSGWELQLEPFVRPEAAERDGLDDQAQPGSRMGMTR